MKVNVRDKLCIWRLYFDWYYIYLYNCLSWVDCKVKIKSGMLRSLVINRKVIGWIKIFVKIVLRDKMID